MKIERTGLILYVRNYDDCIAFYSRTLRLEILFQNEDLCCFDFYGTYLMVEKEDRSEYLNLNPNPIKNFSCIRMNVKNVKDFAEFLAHRNVEVDYQEHPWGKVAKFKDPDGNLIAFKDEGGFSKQVQDFNKKLK